mmetsp:Transcript_20845/g.84880  ORF Transcript_20845/g.84880 Transcript_20845/m.84880 type:complete len:97 (+) Transcript_20845:1148-1438(+)
MLAALDPVAMVDSEEVDQRRWMSQTKTLPSLKCNGHEALLLFVHPDYLFTFMVSKYCIEAFNKKGKKVGELKNPESSNQVPACDVQHLCRPKISGS